MSVIEILYSPKCKECVFFYKESIQKKDGSISKRKKHICLKNKILSKGEKSLSCNDFEPFWEKGG